jgi:chromosome partitioning protein
MDPQATATVAVLADGAVSAYRDGRTMAQVILGGRGLPDVVLRADDKAANRALLFDLAASHIDLAETDGRREPGFDAALREALDSIRGQHDWVIVDAPPNLGMLTWMALAAADECIVPVRTEPYDTMGVGLILGTINKVQRRLNPGLRLGGILPTQYGARKLVDREVLAHLLAALVGKAPVLEPVPDSAAFGHAARNGRIALDAFPAAPGPAAYARMAAALARGEPLPTAAPAIPRGLC